MDLGFVLEKMFLKDIEIAIDIHCNNLIGDVDKFIAKDPLKPVLCPVETEILWNTDFGSVDIRFTVCVYKFYEILVLFGTQIGMVMTVNVSCN